MPDAIVPDRSAWYVRTALDRALTESADRIDTIYDDLEHRFASDKDEYPGAWRVLEQLRGIASHEVQWLQEALDAFSDLPQEVRPVGLGEARKKCEVLTQRRRKVWELRNAQD